MSEPPRSEERRPERLSFGISQAPSSFSKVLESVKKEKVGTNQREGSPRSWSPSAVIRKVSDLSAR